MTDTISAQDHFAERDDGYADALGELEAQLASSRRNAHVLATAMAEIATLEAADWALAPEIARVVLRLMVRA